MKACHVILAACLLLPSAAAVYAQAGDLPLPQEWETHYVWFLVANPEHVPGTPDEEKALTARHIQYQLHLQESGKAIVGGGLGPGWEKSLIGVTILRADSLAEAQAIADADPATAAGRFQAQVREWWVPAGRLPEVRSR